MPTRRVWYCLQSAKSCLETVQAQTFAVPMFGDRNISLLLFKDGTLSFNGSRTTNLSFYNFSDRMTYHNQRKPYIQNY